MTPCPRCGRKLETGQSLCACGWNGDSSATPRNATVLVVAIAGSAAIFLVAAAIVIVVSFLRAPADRVVPTPVAMEPFPMPPPPKLESPAPPPPLEVPEMPEAGSAQKPQIPRELPNVEAEATQSVEELLISRLHGQDRAGRQAAAEALQRRGWQPQTDAQRALVLVAMDNAQAAEAYGDAAIDAWCVALSCGDHGFLGQQAAQCLGRRLDRRAVQPLCKALATSTNDEVRDTAAKALGQIRDQSSLDVLKQALARETSKYASRSIVDAIKKVSDTTDADRLTAALSDDDDLVQLRAAVLVLKQQEDDPKAVAWMQKAMESKDTELREKAIAALAKTATPTAIKMLVARVDGPGYDGPNNAIDGLISIGPATLPDIFESLPKMKANGRWQMLIGLARFGEPAMPGLSKLLPDSSLEMKKAVCQVFGGMGERADVTHKPIEPLVALMLNDPDAPIRRAAAEALQLLKWEPANAGEQDAFEKARKAR